MSPVKEMQQYSSELCTETVKKQSWGNVPEKSAAEWIVRFVLND